MPRDRTQLVLRFVLLLAPTAAVLATGTTSPWLVLIALALGVLAWQRPDSLVGLAVLALVGSVWVAVDGKEVPATVLLSVAALLAFEVASVLAAYGPPELRLEPALVRLWLVRAAVLFLPACLLLLAGRLFLQAPGSTLLWIVGVGAAVAALVVLRGQLAPARAPR